MICKSDYWPDMFITMTDLARATLATSIIFGAPLFAQFIGTSDESTLRWAIQQGGAFAVILVVLFFYRRDWKNVSEFWKQHSAEMNDLVTQATKAQTEMASALRENTQVTHSLKTVINDNTISQRRT